MTTKHSFPKYLTGLLLLAFALFVAMTDVSNHVSSLADQIFVIVLALIAGADLMYDSYQNGRK